MYSYKYFLFRNTLFICIVFSILFVLTFYAMEYESTEKLYTENAEAYIDTVSADMETSFLAGHDLAVIIHENTEFRDYVNSPAPTPYHRRLLTVYLDSVINSMPSLNSQIYLTQPNDEYLLSGKSVMSADYFSKLYGIPINDVMDIINNTTKNTVPQTAVFFSNSGNTNYFTVVTRNSNTFSNPYLIFSVHNMDKLIGKAPFDSTFIINVDNNTAFSNTDISEKELTKLLNGGSSPRYTTITKNARISTTTGEIVYIVLQTKLQYFFAINKYTLYVIPLGLLFFVFAYALSNFMTNKSYKPIEKILKQLEEIVPSTEENEIDYISSVITLLIKRNNTLAKNADINSTKLREKFINDLLHNQLPLAQIAYGVKNHLGYRGNEKPLSLVIVSIDYQSYKETVQTPDNLSTYAKTVQMMFEDAFSDSEFFHYTSLSPTSYCVVVSGQHSDTFKNTIQKLILNAENSLNITLHATISEPIPSPEKLGDIFSVTHLTHTTNAENKLYGSIIGNNDKNISFFYSSDIEEDIYRSCIHSDKDTLSEKITLLLKRNFSTNELYLKNNAAISVLIYALCTRILSSQNITSEDIFDTDYNIYLELKSCRNSAEFSKKTLFIFNNIIDYNTRSKNIYESSYCDKMLAFVHDNYSSDISLSDLASHMNMSQAYVSRLFKKLAACNFKDYLVKVRLDNASRLLLEEPGKSISDIAAAVGFNTSRTFTNAFSTAFGMTPTEYRHSKLK